MRVPEIAGFFDTATNTVSYVVSDPATRKCAVIDPVLDYDPASGRTGTASVNRVVEYITANELEPVTIFETHVHADHLTGAPAMATQYGVPVGIGNRITAVQGVFTELFNTPEVATDGSQFGTLLADGDEFAIGELRGRVIHTPGHTPACNTYVIGNAAFVGDTLFMPDYGTARCDFPGGDAGTLFDSIQKIFALPDDTRLFMCHDYKAPGRDEYAWETTVAKQKANNVHIKLGTSRDEFVRFRNERDATLSMPKLIIPSIQVNMRAGEFPEAEANGTSYLKVPVDLL